MTSRLSFLLIIFALVLSVVARNAELLLLDVIVMIIAFTSWLWGKYCLTGVSYTRHFDADRLFFGEETNLWIELVNAMIADLSAHFYYLHKTDIGVFRFDSIWLTLEMVRRKCLAHELVIEATETIRKGLKRIKSRA